MSVDTKLANQLRLKAQRALAKEFPDRFREIHDSLRSEHGLPPVGAGAAALAEENRRLREQVAEMEKAAASSGRRTRAKTTA